MSDNGSGNTSSRTIDEFTGDTTNAPAGVSMSDVIDYVERRLSQGVRFGVPIGLLDDGTQDGQTIGEVVGSWSTITLAATTGTVTATHNMGIPTTNVTVGGVTAKLPNCRWFIVGIEYGDRTAVTAAPGAPAGAFSIDLLRKVDDNIDTNSIQFRFSVSGFTPDATHPVTVTLYFVPTPV